MDKEFNHHSKTPATQTHAKMEERVSHQTMISHVFANLDLKGTTANRMRVSIKSFSQFTLTHWVNLRLTMHARSSAIDTLIGARTVHV